MEKRIAFFDFDGTLTRHDTFMDLHRTCFGVTGIISAAFYALSRGGLDRSSQKEAFIKYFWAGKAHKDYLAISKEYARTRIGKNLRPNAMEAFESHLDRGDDVWIVTASMKDWVGFWARRYGVPVIGTELEVSGEFLTGRMSTPNCRGPEKVARIRAAIDLDAYSKIYAYGNSSGDREMLELADEPVYKWRRPAPL